MTFVVFRTPICFYPHFGQLLFFLWLFWNQMSEDSLVIKSPQYIQTMGTARYTFRCVLLGILRHHILADFRIYEQNTGNNEIRSILLKMSVFTPILRNPFARLVESFSGDSELLKLTFPKYFWNTVLRHLLSLAMLVWDHKGHRLGRWEQALKLQIEMQPLE